MEWVWFQSAEKKLTQPFVWWTRTLDDCHGPVGMPGERPVYAGYCIYLSHVAAIQSWCFPLFLLLKPAIWTLTSLFAVAVSKENLFLYLMLFDFHPMCLTCFCLWCTLLSRLWILTSAFVLEEKLTNPMMINVCENSNKQCWISRYHQEMCD